MGRGRHDETREFIEAAARILRAEFPMTVRQLFYRLVSVQLIANCQAQYRRTSRIIAEARERGEISWEWIIDRSRAVYSHAGWRDLEAYGEVVARSYRRNYWEQQPCRVFVLVEKDAVIGSIEPVADEYGVTAYPLRGFASRTRAHVIGRACAEALRDGKEVHILYLGDFDPSGECIEAAVERRIARYVAAENRRPFTLETFRDSGGDLPSEIWKSLFPELYTPFEMWRVAILPEDIAKFKLPPLRVKDTDSRTPAFVKKHRSRRCVELDALPPNELRRRLSAEIEKLLDVEEWNRDVEVEKAEREFTAKVMKNFKGMERSEPERGEGADGAKGS